MKKRVFLFLGLCGSPLSAGCTSTPIGPPFACEYETGGMQVCAEYDMPPVTVTFDLHTSCTAEMGTLGSTCPTAGRLGTCTITSSVTGITETDSYYPGDAGTTAAEAETTCTTTSSGTWTPG